MNVHIIESRVKKLLREMGKTQKEMCKDIGRSPEHVNRGIKRGEISETIMLQIAGYLDCPKEYLSDENETESYLPAYRRKKEMERRKKTMLSLCLSYGWTGEDFMKLSDREYRCLIDDLANLIAYYMKLPERSEKERSSTGIPVMQSLINDAFALTAELERLRSIKAE